MGATPWGYKSDLWETVEEGDMSSILEDSRQRRNCNVQVCKKGRSRQTPSSNPQSRRANRLAPLVRASHDAPAFSGRFRSLLCKQAEQRYPEQCTLVYIE